MKLQRYDPPRSFPTKPLPWRQSDDGDWCNAEDVAELEAKCAELEASHAELLTALREVVDQTDGCNSSPIGQDRAYSIARAAIAKAEVKVMP